MFTYLPSGHLHFPTPSFLSFLVFSGTCCSWVLHLIVIIRRCERAVVFAKICRKFDVLLLGPLMISSRI